jgi:hypothetical protein
MHKRLSQLLTQISADDRFVLDEAAVARVQSRVMEGVQKFEAQRPTAMAPFSRRAADALRIFLPIRQFETVGKAAAFAMVSVLALVGGGALSAQAYADAAPGDTMYGVRGLVERAQVAAAPGAASRARVLLDITDRRANDVARLADSSASVEVTARATADFGAITQKLQAELDATFKTDTAAATELAKAVERRAATQQEVLRRAGRTAAPELKVAVNQAARQSERLTIRALAVLVDQHVGGNQAAPRSVVLVNLEERIATTEAQLVDTTETTTVTPPKTGTAPTRVERAKVAIEEAKALVQQERFQAALVKIEEAAELAKEPEEDVVTPTEEDPNGQVEGATDTAPADEPATEPVTSPEDERTDTDTAPTTETPAEPTTPSEPGADEPATTDPAPPAADPAEDTPAPQNP